MPLLVIPREGGNREGGNEEANSCVEQLRRPAEAHRAEVNVESARGSIDMVRALWKQAQLLNRRPA